jgi:hypothetical protein
MQMAQILGWDTEPSCPFPFPDFQSAQLAVSAER